MILDNILKNIKTYGLVAALALTPPILATDEIEIKCSVFNGMIATQSAPTPNVAIDFGSGKASFLVLDLLTETFNSYNPKIHTTYTHTIEKHKQRLMSGSALYAEKYRLSTPILSPKDSGFEYSLSVIASTNTQKQELMDNLIFGLQGTEKDTALPLIIATGYWRMAKISNSHVHVLSTHQEVELTALSSVFNPESTDLTLSGACGVAAETKAFKTAADNIDFTNTSQIKALVGYIFGNIPTNEATVQDPTLIGVLLENIARSVNLVSSNPGMRGYTQSGTSSNLFALLAPKERQDQLIGLDGVINELVPADKIVSREHASLPQEVVMELFHAAGLTDGSKRGSAWKTDLTLEQKTMYRNLMIMLTTIVTKTHNDANFTDTDPEEIKKYKEYLITSLPSAAELPEAYETTIRDFNNIIEIIESRSLSIQIRRSFPYSYDHMESIKALKSANRMNAVLKCSRSIAKETPIPGVLKRSATEASW